MIAKYFKWSSPQLLLLTLLPLCMVFLSGCQLLSALGFAPKPLPFDKNPACHFQRPEFSEQTPAHLLTFEAFKNNTIACLSIDSSELEKLYYLEGFFSFIDTHEPVDITLKPSDSLFVNTNQINTRFSSFKKLKKALEEIPPFAASKQLLELLDLVDFQEEFSITDEKPTYEDMTRLIPALLAFERYEAKWKNSKIYSNSGYLSVSNFVSYYNYFFHCPPSPLAFETQESGGQFPTSIKPNKQAIEVLKFYLDSTKRPFSKEDYYRSELRETYNLLMVLDKNNKDTRAIKKLYGIMEGACGWYC